MVRKIEKYFYAFVLTKHIERQGVPRWLSGQESTCQCRRHRDEGSAPGSGRSHQEETATRSSIPAWKNPMDREAWQL